MTIAATKREIPNKRDLAPPMPRLRQRMRRSENAVIGFIVVATQSIGSPP